MTKPSKEQIEYEAIKGIKARANYLLAKGITAKLEIDTDKMGPAYAAYSGNFRLPGFFDSPQEAVVKLTIFLAQKAGIKIEAYKP